MQINTYLLRHRFQKSHFEHTLYIKSNSNGDIIIVYLYKDGLIFTGNCQHMFEDFRETMKQQIEMIDLRLMSYFLGIKVQQRDDDIFIS